MGVGTAVAETAEVVAVETLAVEIVVVETVGVVGFSTPFGSAKLTVEPCSP